MLRVLRAGDQGKKIKGRKRRETDIQVAHSLIYQIILEKRHPVFVRPTIDFTQEETILKNLIPQIREDILNESLVYQKNMPTVRKQFENLINDTVGDLKPKFLNCALIAIYAYKYFKQDHTEEELVKAGILGWCYKLQDLAMIIVDDILDESKIRYNKPPLYRVVGIKQAILDSIILESAANFLVLKYFSDHKHLVKIQKDLILNIATTTISQKQELSKYEIDELEVFENLIKSFPLLIHAVTSAVYLAGIDDPKIQSIVKKFCVDIAIFGKRYDDFTVFLDPKTIGEKDNTDIQDLAMIIVDDILDESKIRYNKPPLYRVVGIKQAILDSIILESGANFLVLKYFSDHKHLVKIQKDLILNIATTTISQKQELSKYEIDELEVFENLIKSFPLLIHAVTSAVYLAGIDDPKIQSIVKKFCVDIAIFGKRY
uniref:Farnesyl pyrophosphate synthase-like n=1 Tax=Diabrotica virgifera virgifera TaxID=50390 RepID=A0A6P7GC34_DIAVI